MRLPMSIRSGTAVAALLGVAACGGTGDRSAAAADSALTRDLAIAQQGGTAQPMLQDTATAPASAPVTAPPVAAPEPAPAPPVAAAPTPTPRPRANRPRPRQSTPSTSPSQTPAAAPAPAAPAPAPEPKFGSIGSGTSLTLSPTAKVCTNTHKVGDRFSATIASAVSGTEGVSIPAGSRGTFEVTASQRANNSRGTPVLEAKLVSLAFGGETYSVEAGTDALPITKQRGATRGGDAKKVIGGAVAGAIIGQVLGKDTKSTVGGAAAGAAAGTAAAMATADFDGCVDGGAQIAVRLSSPIRIRAN
jgi:outer membrane biosynthesis protein TonB